jgi:hypothetical protein
MVSTTAAGCQLTAWPCWRVSSNKEIAMLLYAKSAAEVVTPVSTADAGKIRLGGGYRLPVPGA